MTTENDPGGSACPNTVLTVRNGRKNEYLLIKRTKIWKSPRRRLLIRCEIERDAAERGHRDPEEEPPFLVFSSDSRRELRAQIGRPGARADPFRSKGAGS